MMRRFQWMPTRWIQRRTNSSIHHKNKISYTSLSIHSIPISSSYNVYTPPHQYYDNFDHLSLGDGRQYSTISSILPHIHIDAPSYARYPLQLQLKLFQSRLFSSNHRGRGNRRNKDPDMRVCQSIDELTQMAYEHKDSMSPRGMSAYWTLVSKLLKKNKFEKVQNIEQMNHQLNDILGHTLQDINTFGYRDLSTVAISLAKIVKSISGTGGKRLPRYGSPQRILYDLIIGDNSSNKEFIFKVIIPHKFDARCLSNLIYAYGLAECVVKFEDDGSTLFDVFAEQVISVNNLNEFKPQHLSNIIWAFATLDEQHPTLFKRLADHIVTLDNLNEFWPQALSNTVWAYATLNEQHSKLYKKVGDHIDQLDNLNDFWPQALKDLVWAYATAEESHPKTFEKIANHVIQLDNLDKFIPQHLSNISWAFATAKEKHSHLFKEIGDHIVGHDNLNSFKPQELSNTLWAYATLDEQHPQLLKKVADHIVTLDNLDRYSSQALKDLVWAFATAGKSHPKLFEKVADHIVQLPNLHKFESQHLSNTVWAYATANQKHPSLFKKVADHVVAFNSLSKFDEQHLSNTLWAFATAGESHPQLYKKVADHIVQLPNLNEFKPQALKDIPWAFATARESHHQLFSKLADEAIKRQHAFIPQEITNFLWAYATNGQVDENLLSSLVPSVKANLDEYTAQGLSNLAWAYSVANVDAPSVFNEEFINSCLKKEDDFIPEALAQLNQWQLWQEEIKSDISLPSILQKRCYEAFISQEIKQSRLQDDVVSSLLSMGLQPHEEVLLNSGYRIDAVVEVNGNQIAVEVDGPSHFIGGELTGSTILKHRQVAALHGMKVVSIPYWEWNMLNKDSKRKEQYLRSSLGI